MKENTERRCDLEQRDSRCPSKKNSETQTSPKEERRSGSMRSLSQAFFAQVFFPSLKSSGFFQKLAF
ncbi:unnamed protein product [Gongylonema pulchrum]|uniref:Uncharacterized protein n=1 Tax=Gongylonema pulchrum TaxID=637853 RepID=A0A3P6S6K9_9BILA|nr:unnamed protein product [Gongylonema pulchrum]